MTSDLILERNETTPSSSNLEAFSTFSPFSVQMTSCHSLDSTDEIVVDDDNDDVAEHKKCRDDATSSRQNEASNGKKISRLILSDDNLDALDFVDGAVKQLGVKTEVEEVHDGVFYPLAQKLIFVVITVQVLIFPFPFIP